MVSKREIKKAFEAGQAAQWRGLDESHSPFEPESEEHSAYVHGLNEDLAEKWNAGGANLNQELGN